MGDFHLHSRADISEHGFFKFRRTGVQYGHDGVKNLVYELPVSLADLTLYVTSGAATMARRNDATEYRAPQEITASSTAAGRLVLRFKLPPDFQSFPTAAIQLSTERGSTTDSMTLTATLRKGATVDATINAQSIKPVGEGAWEIFSLTPGTAWNNGDWLSLVIDFDALPTGESFQVSDVSIAFVCGVGNIQA